MVKKAILRYFLTFLPEKINFPPVLNQEPQNLLKKALMAGIKNCGKLKKKKNFSKISTRSLKKQYFCKILTRKLTKFSFWKVSTRKLTKINFWKVSTRKLTKISFWKVSTQKLTNFLFLEWFFGKKIFQYFQFFPMKKNKFHTCIESGNKKIAKNRIYGRNLGIKKSIKRTFSFLWDAT